MDISVNTAKCVVGSPSRTPRRRVQAFLNLCPLTAFDLTSVGQGGICLGVSLDCLC